MVAKLCNRIGTLLVLCVILVSIPFFLPKILGFETFAVLSGSMEPEYSKGSIVYVKSVASEAIQVGDVITYKMEAATKEVTTHRVKEIEQSTREFITKGDANDTEDAMPVVFERLVGKVVFSIPYLGDFSQFMQSKGGIITAGSVLAVAIVLWIMGGVLGKHKKEKK